MLPCRFNDQRPAVGPYRDVLDPPVSKCDVTFWLNDLAQNQASRTGKRLAAINTAVEATTLNERSYMLRSQDRFLRDNIQANDILIVSIGGNDVALAPTPCTIVSMFGVLSLPISCVEKGFSCGVAPVSHDSWILKCVALLSSSDVQRLRTCSAMIAAAGADHLYYLVRVHAHLV